LHGTLSFLLTGSVARIETVVGAVVAVRANGARERLRPGSSVFQGDIVETTAGASAHLRFADGTELGISPESRLVVDQVVYDPTREVTQRTITLQEGRVRVASRIGALSLVGEDLRGINTGSRDLKGASLTRVNLEGVDLAGRDLRGTLLKEADLSRAQLGRSNLAYADLSNARLRRIAAKIICR
jgi:uncharacterized protein YjbI with pentapeptide repeats